MSVEICHNPKKEASEIYRLWQGCPTVLCTRKGTLFAGWYTGGTLEPSLDNYNVLVRSRDGGNSWSEPLLTICSSRNEETVAIDIQLWLNPQGHMVLYWTQRDFRLEKSVPGHLSLNSMICEDPDAETLVWSKPEVAGAGFLRTQPTVLSSGHIIRCDYDWNDDYYNYSESADGGKNWIRHRAGKKAAGTDFDESMVLESKDGTLRFFARYAPGIVECDSSDGGRIWSEPFISEIQSPRSRFFIRRLRSGNILLIHNDDPSARTKMTACLSTDDGKTFPYSLLLDDRANVSYPDAAEMMDGSILIVYDRGRYDCKEILSAHVTEDDILHGKIIQKKSWLDRIVSKAPEKPFCGEEKYNELHAADVAFRKKHGM